MKDRYVVDTNVLIAASAADPTHPKDIDATPDEPMLRQQIWAWLDKFEQSETRMVLDSDMEIFGEYNNKLGFNDFGIQVVQSKFSTAQVDYVDVKYDENGSGILPAELSPTIHDEADKKMVAAALDSHRQFGEGCVAFAGDTDWHDWEDALSGHNVILEPIVEEWSRAKHAEKKRRKDG